MSHESLTSKPEVLTEGMLAEKAATIAGEAYVVGVNPIEYHLAKNGFDPTTTVDRGQIDPQVLAVQDRIEAGLSSIVLSSGDLQSGSKSRAAEANTDQVLAFAVDQYRTSLIARAYEQQTS